MIERYRKTDVPKLLRGDAAFAIPGLYERLEAEGYRYTIRLKANPILEQQVTHLLTRPVGRPSHKPLVRYHHFSYQAKSWDKPRRVVAKVTWHAGELFPCVGFIVTNLTGEPKQVTRFYNQRGTAEQWIKEGKYVIRWTRLSCTGFDANQVRLQLHMLAYNLGNFLRRLALPAAIKNWSLTTLREKLIKAGARMVRHARYVTLPEGGGSGAARTLPGDAPNDRRLCCQAGSGRTSMMAAASITRRRTSRAGGSVSSHRTESASFTAKRPVEPIQQPVVTTFSQGGASVRPARVINFEQKLLGGVAREVKWEMSDYAAGSGYYAVFFEDPDRIKLEVVVPPE